ncbi:DUF6247 family protein [Streptomyces hesseae]|uniref:DUF6247 family protein n=1 Tax=Streptomyces hesseae TaxID=3075519 RepID=A0ABU2SI85_9ACTN|nr:DUF6247 family protein [Streptomyces sp. DSM 40473]MDT0448099.1 DUF6247 family protein [Streptomyces sp. DSM 40473]
MSARPGDAPAPPPLPPLLSPPPPSSVPAPAAAARLLASIRADRRAERWVPAFERDWAKALEDARYSYSLTPVHDVVRAWQARLAVTPAVDAFLAAGMDDSDGVASEDALGTRP